MRNIPIMKTERLTFTVFLIIVANFILGLLLAWPLLNPDKPAIPPVINSIFIMVFFFIFYLLLLIYLTHYLAVFKEYFKENEVKFILIGGALGLVILAVFSFWKAGFILTLSWLVPSITTILIELIWKFYGKKEKSEVKQEKVSGEKTQ
jgi:hypothetical protein